MHTLEGILTAGLLAFPLCISAQPLIIDIDVQDDACLEGVGCITVFVSGGTPPYAYFWQPIPAAGQGTPSICGLFSGTHFVTVTDADGSEETISVEVGGTPELLLDTSPGVAVACLDPCNGYWQRLGDMGGTAPYIVAVDPPAGTTSAGPNGIWVHDMCVGQVYSVMITDANGCSAFVPSVTVVEQGPPEVVSINQQGICQGFQFNSAQVVFDQAITQVFLVSGMGNIDAILGNTVHLSGLGSGWNIFVVTGDSPFCQQQITIEVEDVTSPCGTIIGTVRADADGNCLTDATDPLVPYRILQVQPGNFLSMTSAGGTYTQGIGLGEYAVNFEGPGLEADCISPYPVPVTISTQDPTVQADLLLTPTIGPDASAFVNTTVVRPGMPTFIYARAWNNSAYTVSDVTLAVDYDPLLEFGGTSAVPSVIGIGHVEWELPELPPYTMVDRSIYVNSPPDAGLIGTNVEFTATVSMPEPDAQPLNDSYVIIRTIVGSYDPNDKLALTSSRTSENQYFLDLDDHVDFTIRFQNTGTAEAIDVYLLDTISPLFDLASFELLGASHAMEISLLEDRVLRFDFPGIMLPDSASDPAGSQGFASFRLKTDGTPSIGSLLSNAADIFFDFNEPIRTNTIEILVEVSTGMDVHVDQDFILYPNPTGGRIHIQHPAGGSVEVWSMDGRVVVLHTLLRVNEGLDVSNLTPGIYLLRFIDPSGVRYDARFVKH